MTNFRPSDQSERECPKAQSSPRSYLMFTRMTCLRFLGENWLCTQTILPSMPSPLTRANWLNTCKKAWTFTPNGQQTGQLPSIPAKVRQCCLRIITRQRSQLSDFRIMNYLGIKKQN